MTRFPPYPQCACPPCSTPHLGRDVHLITCRIYTGALSTTEFSIGDEFDVLEDASATRHLSLAVDKRVRRARKKLYEIVHIERQRWEELRDSISLAEEHMAHFYVSHPNFRNGNNQGAGQGKDRRIFFLYVAPIVVLFQFS